MNKRKFFKIMLGASVVPWVVVAKAPACEPCTLTNKFKMLWPDPPPSTRIRWWAHGKVEATLWSYSKNAPLLSPGGFQQIPPDVFVLDLGGNWTRMADDLEIERHWFKTTSRWVKS